MQQRSVSSVVHQRAALVAGVVTFVVAFGLLEVEQRRFRERVSGGAPVVTLAAARDLEPGAVFDASALVEVSLPGSYVDARRVLGRDRARLLGRPVSTALRTGEGLVWSDVVTADGPTRLSLMVEPGRRAAQLPAAVNSLGFLLRPSDRVDVLLVFEGRAETLLEDVRVLAVGNQLRGDPEPDAAGSSGKRSSIGAEGVTLDVSSAEAETLLAGERRGALRLVLRHPKDAGGTRRAAPAEPASRPRASTAASVRRQEIEHVR